MTAVNIEKIITTLNAMNPAERATRCDNLILWAKRYAFGYANNQQFDSYTVELALLSEMMRGVSVRSDQIKSQTGKSAFPENALRSLQPPEPVANPNEDWVESYSRWYHATSVPAANWRKEGQRDPHNSRYDCKRHELFGGTFTDDELANAQFMMDGDTVKQTMVKDRIRWLSRQLEKANSEIELLKSSNQDKAMA